MRKITPFFYFSLSFLIFLGALPVTSSAADEDEKKRELPKSGVLAGTRIGGDQGVAMQGPWGREDGDIFSDEQPPITGSVSRKSARDWVARMKNNSEDKYSVSIRIVEYDKRDQKTKSTSYSAVLNPGQSWEREFMARTNTQQAELQLSSWRNLSPKKEKSEEESADEDQEGQSE